MRRASDPCPSRRDSQRRSASPLLRVEMTRRLRAVGHSSRSARRTTGVLQRGPLDERLDREELRLRLAVRARTELLDRWAQLVLCEALEVFLRLPDVVDIPALVG